MSFALGLFILGLVLLGVAWVAQAHLEANYMYHPRVFRWTDLWVVAPGLAGLCAIHVAMTIAAIRLMA